MLEAKNLNKEISIKKIDDETLNVKIFNNDILAAIVGEFNKNLIKIEKLTNTQVFFRGNSITVKGNKESILAVSNSLIFLVVFIRVNRVSMFFQRYRSANSFCYVNIKES